MIKFFARRELKKFSDHYGYDVSYMQHMLDNSSGALFKFSRLTKLSEHNDIAPLNALYAAKLVGAVAEDCGPCVQLVADMALEAGMPSDQIIAVLERDVDHMSEDTALGFAFADAVVTRAMAADSLRDKIRAAWGNAGVIDLTLAVQIGRIYPMVKFGLGFAKTCARVGLKDLTVNVVKAAA